MKTGNVKILLGSLLAICLLGALPADKTTLSEYRIKAALVYKLLQFTEWPDPPPARGRPAQGKNADVPTRGEERKTPPPFRIGLCGMERDPDLVKLFLPLESKTLGARPIRIVTIERKDLLGKRPPVLDEVDALYLAGSLEHRTIARVLKWVKTRPVLTFGEIEQFLGEGGDIRFLRDGNHIRFEVSLVSLKAVSLKIKTSVLKLAKRVIKNKEKAG